MAKASSRWVCTECGAEQTGWYGRCPACGAWNTVEEQALTGGDRVVLATGGGVAVPLSSVPKDAPRLATGIGEIDRVLGGGLVAGSVVLLHGPPGIGKSTLLLQAAASLALGHERGPIRRPPSGSHAILYASGEESVGQVASRAGRLGADRQRLLVMAETRTESIFAAAREMALGGELGALIVDSVQTVYSSEHDGLPGNVSQIRAVAAQLVSFAKQHDVPVIVVGHVTKDGQLAGPRLLEHMVDTVLSFEGDEERATRLLRATKNRFGSTLELGVFEMASDGLREVSNPSEAFLAQRPEGAPGSCITVSLQGSRPLLLEVQALLASNPGGGNPRRNCVGIDANRLAMMLAVLDRHGDQFVLDQDVFVNVTGGMRLHEPAADLAVLLAVASSHRRIPLPHDLVAVGEIGLTGELRSATRLESRLTEAARLGFRKAIIAPTKGGRKPKLPKGLDVRAPPTVRAAIDLVIH